MKSEFLLRNGFLLLLPILLWNAVCADALPPLFQGARFWEGVPTWMRITENGLRVLVFILPGLMLVSTKGAQERVGLYFYLLGATCYFLSWIPLILYPESPWSISFIGIAAPAYTPLLWLIGIGMMGSKSIIKGLSLRWIYIGLSLVFTLIHTWHTYISLNHHRAVSLTISVPIP